MIVHWFTNAGIKQFHTHQLANVGGSKNIRSGQLLQPVSLDLECADNELVTVVYQIVNLGSFDAGEQAGAALQIAQKGAEAFASVYMEAVEFVVANSGLPLAQVFAEGIDELTPVIVDSVGAAFEDIIIPAISELADLIAAILGRPNCNGDVLHDIAIFKPSQMMPPHTVSKVYTASSQTGCGGPARTAVDVTLERWLDAVPLFPSGPPPKAEAVPGTDIPMTTWLGTWIDDPFTSLPRITVTISRSLAASGSFMAEITENVDLRFSATFEAAKDILTPTEAALPPVGDDVFATIRPWTTQHHAPFNLQPVLVEASGGDGDGDRDEGSIIPELWEARTTFTAKGTEFIEVPPVRTAISFRREWGVPINPPPLVPSPGRFDVPVTELVTEPGQGITPQLGFQTVLVLDLSESGILLGIYPLKYGATTIGFGVRYIRDQNASFTRADVMLSKLTPVA